jgi:hypothetical protein
MAQKHYLIELTTEIGVVVDDKDVSATKSMYQVVMDRVQLSLDNQDLNDKDYQIKVLGEGK